jgi:putative methionine-R-sulfoxide reductase with GAF domain
LEAELDIESYFTNAFTEADQVFVEACAALVAKFIGKS